MKKIYRYSCCRSGLGEVEGMFDIEGELIDCWMLDDAKWREEYFGGLMDWLGVDVQPLPKVMRGDAEAQMAEQFGLTLEDTDDEN